MSEEDTATEPGLSVRELLQAVYAAFQEQTGVREITMPNQAWAEIADDSDWHRTHKGFSIFTSCFLLPLGGNKWCVSLGFAGGGYPADPYDCDLVAVQLKDSNQPDEELGAAAHQALSRSTYFCNSLFIGTYDGNLGMTKGSPFYQAVIARLEPSIVNEYTAQRRQIDPEVMYADLRPVVTVAVRYKPEFVPVLTEILLEILASSP